MVASKTTKVAPKKATVKKTAAKKAAPKKAASKTVVKNEKYNILRAEHEILLERCAVAIKALEPFAKLADKYWKLSDNYEFTNYHEPNVGHLRAAQQAWTNLLMAKGEEK